MDKYLRWLSTVEILKCYWFWWKDTITGNNDKNTLRGGISEDTIKGEGGDDFIYGGTQNDTLSGGQGNDLLDGESGTGDFADYSDITTGGVTIDLSILDGINNTGNAGTDTLKKYWKSFRYSLWW